MADNTLILDGDEPLDQFSPEDNMDDVDPNASGEEEDFMDDAAGAADDPDDDDEDFKLDGFDDLGIPDDDEDEDDAYDPEYDDNVSGRKRKRNRNGSSSKTPQAIQRFTMPGADDDGEAFILNEDNQFLNKASSRVPGTFGRRNRRKGESLPAYHKRVSHELDSDDEMMMGMRERGFSDRQIADRLARDGRVRYDQKSISTRIMRIRLAQAENVDFLLREGYKEWEYDDDELLIQAHALADIEINYEIERIRAWRFRKVSEYMRRLNKEALFSATACRERYNALMDGTARIPTEQDDDPDTRRAEMEAYRISRETVRNQEKAKKDAKEATEAKIKNDAKAKNAQKAEEVAGRRAIKEAEKAQRAMTRAAQAQIRAQRAKENSNAKTLRNVQIKKQKDDLEKKKRGANKNATLTLTTGKVSDDTPDPRAYLSVSDLKKMAQDRGLELPTKKDKDSLVQALKDADDEYSQVDLKKMCHSKGLDANGSKIQMKYQLALASAQVLDSYESGVAAAAAAGDGDDEMEVDEE